MCNVFGLELWCLNTNLAHKFNISHKFNIAHKFNISQILAKIFISMAWSLMTFKCYKSISYQHKYLSVLFGGSSDFYIHQKVQHHSLQCTLYSWVFCVGGQKFNCYHQKIKHQRVEHGHWLIPSLFPFSTHNILVKCIMKYNNTKLILRTI